MKYISTIDLATTENAECLIIKGFIVDLKTFIGLALPNQSWFWGDILGQEILNLHDLYIQHYCTV